MADNRSSPLRPAGSILVTRVRNSPRIRTASVTVLFADLRGYTGMVERLPAAQVVPLLDEFVRVLGGAATKFGGEVYHVAGDGIMAGFGVNSESNGGASQALSAGHAMLEGFAQVADAGAATCRSMRGSESGCTWARWLLECWVRRSAKSRPWWAIPSMSPRDFAAGPAPAKCCFLARSPRP